MDPDERLTALKRAYADIILNTAKEAAARIMASERKAVRYQHELLIAKDESLGMLLRLKQMMDSKISEAALASSSQQKKIEELEAQLQEAEDIVNDLRVELREVQAELERVNNFKEKEVQSLEEYDRVVLPSESREESATVSSADVTNVKQENQCYQSCGEMVQIGKPCLTGPDLPSIILRSKVPDKNGCTQRIRAYEGPHLDGELSLSKRGEKLKIENGYEVDDSAPILKVDDMVKPQENFQEPDDLLSSWYLPKSFRRKRRRALRNRKGDYPSPRSSPDHFLNTDKTSNTDGLRAHFSPARVCAPAEDPSDIVHSLSKEKADPVAKLALAEMYGNDSDVQDATVGDELVMAKIDPLRQESRSLERLEVPVNCSVLEKVSGQLLNSESKTSDVNDEVPNQTLNERVIKYTFQRKRKRGSSSIPEENAPLEKISSKGTNEEKPNGPLEPKIPSSVTESSRDSRRVAQVARQLISLSEKKWWK